MKQEIANKWVTALRSGKYKQGTNCLRTKVDGEGNDKYCCLGVLCDIVDPKGWEPAAQDTMWRHGGEGGYLTPAMVREVEISLMLQTKLIRMNDGEGKNFNEIADAIEADQAEQAETYE